MFPTGWAAGVSASPFRKSEWCLVFILTVVWESVLWYSGHCTDPDDGFENRSIWWNENWKGKPNICRRLDSVLFRPPQITYERTWNWTRAATVVVGVQCCDFRVTRIVLGRKNVFLQELTTFFFHLSINDVRLTGFSRTQQPWLPSYHFLKLGRRSACSGFIYVSRPSVPLPATVSSSPYVIPDKHRNSVVKQEVN
jgi:hypothetical protein